MDEDEEERGEQSLMALFSRRTVESTPLDGVDVVLADLDGVVYAGAGALPHAVASLTRAARDVGSATSRITHLAPTHRSPPT